MTSGLAPGGGTRRDAVRAALIRLVPSIPDFEAEVVTDRALDSRGLSTARPEVAAWLCVVAYVRHTLTDYDDLLAEGYDADSARFFVRDGIDSVLKRWGSRRKVAEGDVAPDDG